LQKIGGSSRLPVAQFRQAAARHPADCELTVTRLGPSVSIGGSNIFLGAASAIPRKILEPPMHTDGHRWTERREATAAMTGLWQSVESSLPPAAGADLPA
jgi:hypothetical protein